MLHDYNKKLLIFEALNAKGELLAKTSHNEIVKLFIESNGIIAPHALPVHVTFYITKGAGTGIVDNARIAVSKGDVLEVAPDLLRGWENDSKSDLEILVIKQL
jgi:quercetin dioxygenase-like cupin family protein